jgi:ribonuclease-3
MKNSKTLEKNLTVKFKNKNLLKQALTHRSYLNEHSEEKIEHNERLEFLGDAVLELAVSEYLYQKYPNPEGELTSWRASLVNTDSLANLAQNLDLNSFLFLSKGETRSTGKARNVILANAFEAVIGAIYLDQGFKKTKDFIIKNLVKKLPEIIKKELYKDAKSRFQEISQAQFKITPSYKVLKEEGPAHEKIFTVGLYLGDKFVSQGTGSSKFEAEMKAAEKALREM